MTHTVEKIGGTSMSRLDELRDTLFLGGERQSPYGRIFVVSAFGGITNLLLEHKKSGKRGVFAAFADGDEAWRESLETAADAMVEAHRSVLSSKDDIARADEFVAERMQGMRDCLTDLMSLCAYSHFSLSQHMLQVREMLSGLGEAHSAFVATLMLNRAGAKATFVDLSGWRDDGEVSLDERINAAMEGIDPSQEIPIVTGYAQCREGLMKEFDRGYSEVTFSRLAALTGASEAVIHKEFHLSSADPNLVGHDVARKLGHTNYDVADQMSNMGMEAIHPSAAKTLRQADVPLRVTNAFQPDDPGTLIDDRPAEKPAVEMVTGLDIVALEVFEQDMVGVKGYDSAILEVLTSHGVRIVSKVSNANTITHYLDASLKRMGGVERDLARLYPNAEVSARPLAMVSAIGRDLGGLSVLTDGLRALADAGLYALGASQGPRDVDVQFILDRDALKDAIRALHEALIAKDRNGVAEAA
ncbi:aspartate kinase [Paracoccus sp. TK19116]|uniref:aspartate kinase n=1 Tax=Paracoccus albicereus TaxID=2922394 RepID=A0ABT1MQ51_9RHOB|nr:aspartate kinase [Paracoccus albicereus]MCQ0969636.1 aspartate kinase [Paracoccus albicereus]